MKILYHHRTRGSGAEGAHIRGIVSALREMEHDVQILSFPGADPELSSPPSENKKSEKKNIIVDSIKKISVLTKYAPEFVFEFFELCYNGMAFFRLTKVIKENSIELIYERYSLFMFIGVLLANKQGIPIILEVNDSALVQRVRPLMFKGIAKKFEKWIFSKCTGIVFISSHFQEVVQLEYKTIAKSVISPNSADLSIFDPKQYNKKAIKEELNLADKVICGYVGAFNPWHGIDWFVEIIAPRIKENPSLVLLLVGDGICYEFIKDVIKKEHVEDQIVLTGKVAHGDVAKYLAAMDFGILPDSNTYGSPMKLFEFMAMNCGMVIPDFSPIQEVVSDEKTSWLFSKNDKEACIDLVLEVSKSPNNQIRVGKNARAYIENERQWRHNAELMLTLLE